MKRLVALLLTLVLVLGMFGCGTTQEPAETELGPEVVTKKDYSMWAGIVNDPKTWYDELMAPPIANADMSTDELRQLCVDAFKVNLSFTWTPNEDIAYTYELLDKYTSVMLPADGLYSSSSWHVMMCSEAPKVVRDAKGKIDPYMSTMLIVE